MKSCNLGRTIAIAIFTAMVLFAVNSFAQFGGGDGTEASPWIIETAEHLNNVRNYTGAEHTDKHFMLGNDIDLGEAPWNEGEGWMPIGSTVADGFYGRLNGNGKVIKNLTINHPEADYQGLLGCIGSSSEIINLGLLNVSVVGNEHVGAIVGYIDDRGNRGNIERCYSTGKVEGLNNVGGIVGTKGMNTTEDSSVYDCYSNTHVYARGLTGNISAGGVVGNNTSGETHCCYATGLVETAIPSHYTAAVVGNIDEGDFSSLYWNIDTVGQTEGATFMTGQFPGSSTVQMLQENTYRGFDFRNVWTIDEGSSYAYLRWQGDTPDNHNLPRLLPPRNLSFTAGGGFVDLTWLAPAEEIGIPDGYNVYRNQVRINRQPIQELSYRDDEAEDWTTYTYYVTAVYGDDESGPSGGVHPTTIRFDGGDGTTDNPFQITTAEQLDGIRYFLKDHFILQSDIDLGVAPWNEDEGWIPIGVTSSNAFSGQLDGNGHVIKSLTINRQGSYQGFFSYLTGDAKIVNLGLKGVDIISSYSVGAFVGQFEGQARIERCYVTGRVEGDNWVGGIAGRKGTSANRNNYILDCYSKVHIFTRGTSTVYAGGIAGIQYGEGVSRCYVTGKVELLFPSARAAAVVGYISPGTASHIYWNRDTVGQTEGVGNMAGQFPGSSTAQLLQAATYQGFDFDSVWNINEDESYAYLRWQGDEPDNHNLPGVFPPRNVVYTVGIGFVNLTWDAPLEEMGVPDGYNVYRNRERINQQLVEDLHYRDEGADEWITYAYYITAVRDGDESPVSESVFATPVGFAGGDGTADNPFQMATAEQLSGTRFALNSHFIQTDDIDISDIANWEPVGNATTRFQGHYNGDGFEIRGLRRTTSLTNFGLFGVTGDGAVFENMSLTDVETFTGANSGAIVGSAANTIFRNCTVQGHRRYTGTRQGGIVGQTSGTTSIYRCSANMSYLDSGSGSQSGGIVGHHNATGNVEECFALVEISSTGVGVPSTGGLVGQLQNGSVINCYAIGSIETTQLRGTHGGLVGGNNGNRRIINSYAVVTYTFGGGIFGGLVGSGSPNFVENSYWDSEVVRTETSPGGGSPRITRQMVQPYDNDTYVGWDFEDVWTDDIGNINGGYPILAYQYTPVHLSTPKVTIKTIERDGTDYVKLQWNAIESANSYKVYATTNLDLPFEEWDVRTHSAERIYEEVIVQEEQKKMFYRVQALTSEAPDGREDNRRRTQDRRSSR